MPNTDDTAVEEVPTTAGPPVVTTAPGRPRTTTTTEPVELLGGGARIFGNVLGPQGLATGAVVRVERLVGSEEAVLDVGAGTGGYNVQSLKGGRYRVRAWRAPDMILLEPEVFFLAADEQKNLDLRLTRVSEVNVRPSTDPDRLPAQEPFTLTLFLYAGSVTADGILEAIPRANETMQLAPGPGLALVSSDRATTDGGGRAVFRLRCLSAGSVSADVVFSVGRFPVALPNCPG